MTDLKEIRGRIDETDEKIVCLFEDRLDISAEVAEVKRATGSPVYVPEREKEKIEKVKAAARNEENERSVASLYQYIMLLSRMKQYGMLLKDDDSAVDLKATGGADMSGAGAVYQGVPGAYGHQAAMGYFGEYAPLHSAETFRDAMEEVKNGSARYCVLPIENTSTGIIDDVYDLLAEYDNYIVGEYTINVEHALLGLPGAELSDIKRVYSHPQGLLQSREFLSRYGWEETSMKNTALAAMAVRDRGDKSCAAVASKKAAEIYGLKVLQDNINDNKNNSTRFIIVSGEREYFKGADTISICFELPHEAGTLYKVLTYLYYSDLSMTRIESRPIQGKKFEYRFYVDFMGCLSGENERTALKVISKETDNFRILGNYKGGTS